MNLHGVSPDDAEELVRQLDLIVRERGGLWEPLGSSAVVLPERTETHGPWSVEACAQVLLRWLDAEFIGIYRESAGAEAVDLSVAEARAVLTDPTAWRPALELHLFPTAKGENAGTEDWRGILGDLSA